MSMKLRGFAVVLGVAVAMILGSSPVAVRASDDCEDQQCLRLCAGGNCTEDCYGWSEWACAGGSGWCISVMCPIYPE